MAENKDTFKKSIKLIDKSIEKIISLNKYLVNIKRNK